MSTLQYIVYTLLLQGFEGTKRDIDEAISLLIKDKIYDIRSIEYSIKILYSKGLIKRYTRASRNKKQIVYRIGNIIDIQKVLQLDL